jgi:hypothetical protein
VVAEGSGGSTNNARTRNPHLSSSQSGKIAALNAMFDLLDSALTQATNIDVSGSGDVTPPAATIQPFA